MANVSQKWLDNFEDKLLDLFGIFNNDYSLEIHASEVAKRLKIPQRTALRGLDNLLKINILKSRRIGKNKIYSVNFDNPSIIQFLTFSESYKALNFTMENPKIAIILNEIKEAKIVFGSYSKKTNNKNSDLDLVLLGKENEVIKNEIKKSHIEINPHFITLNELKKLLNEKNALALEIAKNHIILGDTQNIVKLFMDHYN